MALNSNLPLKGKVALVTGASRGIGKSIAWSLAQHGAMVFINGRKEESLDNVCKEFSDKKLDFQKLIFSVSDPNSIKEAFLQLYNKTKKLDILINNAGIMEDGLMGMLSQDQIIRTFETNTFSVLHTCQFASRIMKKQNSGSIINISSIIGTNGNSGQSTYSGSKAAVIGITKSLSKELAAYNINVNAICPGFIDTDLVKSTPDDLLQETINRIAMKKIGKPEDVANLATFLSLPASSYITGQIIGVDGGMLI